MVRKGCNSLVRAEKILTHIAWVGVASYMELLKKVVIKLLYCINKKTLGRGFCLKVFNHFVLIYKNI